MLSDQYENGIARILVSSSVKLILKSTEVVLKVLGSIPGMFSHHCEKALREFVLHLL